MSKQPATFSRSQFKKPAKISAFRKSKERDQAKRGTFFVPTVTTPDTVYETILYRLKGDEKLAKRIMNLMAQFPLGTLPELITYDWLQSKHISFMYQVELFGGRRIRGGVVPDFVVMEQGDRTQAQAWQVQGEYWHTLPGARERDAAKNISLLGADVEGARITQVIELWEGDIYDKRPRVFQMALAGIGMREAWR